MKLLLFSFFTVFICTHSICQKKTSIEIYTNPFIYRGNVNNQFTSVNNKYVDGEYTTPYIFESGFNYKVSHKKWGWYAGLSFMSEQQTFTMTSYIPDYHYINPVDQIQVNFDSNYLGMKAGFNYSLNEKLILNFGVNVFNPISFLEKGPFWNGLDIVLNNEYLVDPAAENPQTAEVTFAKYEYKLYDLFPVIYLIPEFSLDYKILPNTHLTLGARFKFWTKRTDTRFIASVEGYFDQNIPQDEILHESEVTNRGLYTYIGLKYDIFLKKEKR
jgi:hypothetical protein